MRSPPPRVSDRPIGQATAPCLQFRTDGTRRRCDPTARCSGWPRVDLPAGRRALRQAPDWTPRHGHRARRGADKVSPTRHPAAQRTSRLGRRIRRRATLLDAITDIARGVINDFGGVAAVAYPHRGNQSSATPVSHRPLPIPPHANRLIAQRADCCGSPSTGYPEHETADDEVELSPPPRPAAGIAGRQRGPFCGAAEAAGSCVDELVSVDPATVDVPRDAVARVNWRCLAFNTGYRSLADNTTEPTYDQRLSGFAGPPPSPNTPAFPDAVILQPSTSRRPRQPRSHWWSVPERSASPGAKPHQRTPVP